MPLRGTRGMALFIHGGCHVRRNPIDCINRRTPQTDSSSSPAVPAEGSRRCLRALRDARHSPLSRSPAAQVVKEQIRSTARGCPGATRLSSPSCASSCAIRQMQAAADECTGPVFFDRGIVDAVAFFDYLGRDVPARLERAAAASRTIVGRYSSPRPGRRYTQARERLTIPTRWLSPNTRLRLELPPG